MVDPKINDPYPTVIQSTIVEQNQQSDGSAGSTTKFSRVYQRSGIGKMLSYKQNDIVASVRLVTRVVDNDGKI